MESLDDQLHNQGLRQFRQVIERTGLKHLYGEWQSAVEPIIDQAIGKLCDWIGWDLDGDRDTEIDEAVDRIASTACWTELDIPVFNENYNHELVCAWIHYELFDEDALDHLYTGIENYNHEHLAKKWDL